MKTVKKHALLLLFLLAVVSCKDQEEVKPKTGSYVIWTDKSAKTFDLIEVTIDDKLVGTITKPYNTGPLNLKPDCNTLSEGALVQIQLPVGTHKLKAKATLKGEKTDGWEGNFEITENECKKGLLPK